MERTNPGLLARRWLSSPYLTLQAVRSTPLVMGELHGQRKRLFQVPQAGCLKGQRVDRIRSRRCSRPATGSLYYCLRLRVADAGLGISSLRSLDGQAGRLTFARILTLNDFLKATVQGCEPTGRISMLNKSYKGLGKRDFYR